MTVREPGKYESLAFMWADFHDVGTENNVFGNGVYLDAFAKSMFYAGAHAFSVVLSRLVDLECRQEVTQKEAGRMMVELRKEANEGFKQSTVEWRALAEEPKT